MPDPLIIKLDQGPPTEPGDYIAKFDRESCQPTELIKVVATDDRRAKVGLWLFRKDGNGPLELYHARWSRRIEVQAKEP